MRDRKLSRNSRSKAISKGQVELVQNYKEQAGSDIDPMVSAPSSSDELVSHIGYTGHGCKVVDTLRF